VLNRVQREIDNRQRDKLLNKMLEDIEK